MVTAQLYNMACLLFFSVEMYHVVIHFLILCGLRTLPRKDLVDMRYYFLADALSVFISSFLLTGTAKWLALIHIVVHLFYLVTWDKSNAAKKIIDWSSLEWFSKSDKQDTIGFYLGTLGDIITHVVLAHSTGGQLEIASVLLAFSLTQAGVYYHMFSPRSVWSCPQRVPTWIQSRLGM